MSVNQSQETCSTALKNCPLRKLYEFLEHLDPVIGRIGGRRFIVQKPLLPGTLSMNDIVQRLETIWKDLSKRTQALDQNSVEAILSTITKIHEKDKEASEKLNKKNFLIRIFTAIRSFFGNMRFNRKEILASIEKAAKGNLSHGKIEANTPVSVPIGKAEDKPRAPAVEKPPGKKEEIDPIAEHESKVAALIKAVSLIDSNNYNQTKQLIVNSANDIVCEAIRRSISDGQWSVFLATMGSNKLLLVFKAAAQKALNSNDYQLFTLLFSRSLQQCSKEEVINITKLATNGSEDKIEIIRAGLSKHLSDVMWIKIYENILNDVKSNSGT